MDDGSCLCCNATLLATLELPERVVRGVKRVRARLAALEHDAQHLFLADYAEELITYLLGAEYVVPILTSCVRTLAETQAQARVFSDVTD